MGLRLLPVFTTYTIPLFSFYNLKHSVMLPTACSLAVRPWWTAQTLLQQRLGASPAWLPPSPRPAPVAPGDRPAADTAFLTCELLPRQSPARLPSPTCLGRVSWASPTALLSSAARSGSLSSPQLPRSLDPRPLLHRDAHPLGCLSGSPPLPPQQI